MCLALLVGASVVLGGCASETANSTTASTQAVQAPQVPQIDQNELQSLALNSLKNGILESSWVSENILSKIDLLDKVVAIQNKDQIEIDVNTIDLTFKAMRDYGSGIDYHQRIAEFTFIDASKKIFASYPKITYVRLVFWTDQHDSHGNTVKVVNLKMAMNKENFEKTNWDALKTDVIWGKLDTSIFQEWSY